MSSNYADYYYHFLVGEHPDESDYNATAATFEHLKDAGFNEDWIFQVINQMPIKDSIKFDDIPDALWNNSLVIRGNFYFHKELQIKSPPPTWEHSFPFYLEMKIKYTVEDVLEYFLNFAHIRTDWVNREKELGSIRFLLKDYKKFSFMEPVDFLLHLIDYCVADGMELNSIYDLRDKEIELANYLEVDTANAVMQGKNKIVWRS